MTEIHGKLGPEPATIRTPENRWRPADRPRGARSSVGVEVARDAGGFAALEGEWDELFGQSPAATPFQSWGWLFSWWEHHGPSGGRGLRLLVARDAGGRLVGLAPMMTEGRRLLFVGTGQTGHNDILVREGWESEVPGALAGALRGMGGWSAADLQELRPGAAAWGVFDRWPGRQTSLWQSYCTLVEVRPWDELLAALRKKHRSDARRALKRSQEEGLRVELAGPEEAGEAARRLVAINRDQWRDRWQETGPEHWTDRFEKHLCATARRVTDAGLGGISEFWKDGRVVLSTFLLFGRETVSVYMVGADKEALRQYSYSSLFVRDMIDHADARGTPYIDFLSGDDPYKLRWTPEVVPNRRVILGRNLLSWLPFAGYLVLRQRAVRFARSEDSPAWAREAAKGYRRLHYRAARLVRSGWMPRRISGLAGKWFKEV